MRLGKIKKFDTSLGSATVRRNSNGIPIIEAKHILDAFYVLGWVHAMDRLAQMTLMVILGQGRTAEKLINKHELVCLDVIMRRQNIWNRVVNEKHLLQNKYPDLIKILEAYSSGVNHYRDSRSKPLECALLGIAIPRWSPEHSMLIAKTMGYFGFVQGQEDVERFIVQSLQMGARFSFLQEFFDPFLRNCDPELLRKVKLRPVKNLMDITLPNLLPLSSGSNNWVIGAERSATGSAFLCNDPHLEINRLPAFWSEIVIQTESVKLAGASVPGIPGVLVGRNQDVSFGVTYSMADTSDCWIHQCRQGKFLWQNKWKFFKPRQEKISRRWSKPLYVQFYDLPDGSILEGEPLDDGYYLSTKWAGIDASCLDTMQNLYLLNCSSSVKQAMKSISNTNFPALNWVFADRSDNIGYQIGGAFPNRRSDWSGLYPLPGWHEENLWHGYLNPSKLPQEYNPDRGYIITANNDLNQPGKPVIINLPLPAYRKNRIEQLICQKSKMSTGDMKKIQLDVYSMQAEKLISVMKPYLKNSPGARILNNWDFSYSIKEKGPIVFENILKHMCVDLLIKSGLSNKFVRELYNSTGITELLSHNFDTIFSKQESEFFSNEKLSHLIQNAVNKGLDEIITPWGDSNYISLNNIFFDGRLPAWLGFDVGPFPLQGGRATPCQGNIFTIWNRKTSFAPSYRFITDMGQNMIETCLPGGPSGNRFSGWYYTDIIKFFRGEYKKLYF